MIPQMPLPGTTYPPHGGNLVIPKVPLPGTTYPPHGGNLVIPKVPLPGTTYPPHGGNLVIPKVPLPGTTYPPHGGNLVIPKVPLPGTTYPPHGGNLVIPKVPLPGTTYPPHGGNLVIPKRPNPPRVGVLKISDWIRNIPSSIKPRPLPRKPAATKIDAQRFSNILIVKFHEGSAMRQTEPGGKTVAVVEAKVTPEEVARLKRLGLDHGQVRQHLDAVNRLLQDDAVERVEPVFRAANEARIAQHRAEGMARSGVDLADLGLYLHIVLKPGTDTREAERLVDRLNASPIVEIAYPAPIAALGGATQTPSFTNWQGYLGPAPFGIDVAATWSLDPTGGRGYGVRVTDTEGGWDFNHEDFPRSIQ